MLVSVAVIAAIGVSAVALNSSESKLLLAAGGGALVALFLEVSIFTNGRRRSAW